VRISRTFFQVSHKLTIRSSSKRDRQRWRPILTEGFFATGTAAGYTDGMISRSSILIRALLAIVLVAGSFLSGAAVGIVKTASTMRQLATDLGQAQTRIGELEGRVTVSADDLNSKKAVVIGRLGSPLGTMLAIRGIWKQSRMKNGYEWFFHVTHVNGQAFDEPVIFHRSLVHVRLSSDLEKYGSREDDPMPFTDQSYEIRAYETGRFSDNPRGYQKKLTTSAFRSAAPAWWRHFQTDLHGIMHTGSGDVSGGR
jgi:hypothetical protein